MLFSEQARFPASHIAHDAAGAFGPRGGSIQALAREIEETQRRQGETIAHIVERMRALETPRHEDVERPLPQFAPEMIPAAPPTGDEPWDAASAEALMQSFETGSGPDAPRADPPPPAGGGHYQDWLGSHLTSVTTRIRRTLSDLKPGSTIRLLEERLEQYQKHISSALTDVVRRSDLDGLRLIETHINYLGDKLDELERHVSRLDGIEADVRSIMDQVSEERIAKLLDYDTRFAADLEAVATRAAEEVHTRLGHDEARMRADTQRHDELRSLIEESIRDRRRAEAEAATLVTGLSGRVEEQADRYDELKGLLEHAIVQQRQHEESAVQALDTLQQAMVRILDRLDTFEEQAEQKSRTRAQEATHAPQQAHASFDDDGNIHYVAETSQPAETRHHRARADDDFNPDPADDEALASVEVPSAFAQDAGHDLPDPPAKAESAIDRVRREFIAEARRAKLKAAANRAEAAAAADAAAGEPPHRLSIESARASLAQAPRAQPTAGPSRLFGASPKLLAGALALVIAINGGILLINRQSAPRDPLPAATSQPLDTQTAPAPGPDAGSKAQDGTNSLPNPGERSDLDDWGATDLAEADAETEDAADGSVLTPYGIVDDVLNPPKVDPTNTTAAAPVGTTIARQPGTMPDDVVADVYLQQILAGLSGQVGDVAAGHSANGLLPEENGRIETAYTKPETDLQANDANRKSNALDLPPATVGPLSLRLAAANGDASAEFEVAARLAEGKGTEQNFAEAARWYQRSAARGFAQSQYRLGTFYERGLGVAKDAGRSRVWYARSAEQGNVKSMHNLAVMAAGGEQGEPDYATALQWFSKAAEYGLADSQYNLAVLLENGLGVQPDRVTAYKWYALAAKSGDKDALTRRDAVKPQLSSPELKTAEGMVSVFKPQAQNPLANDARAAGEDWKKRANKDAN